MTEEEKAIRQIADKLAEEKSYWKPCDFDDQYYVNLIPSAQRLHAAGFGNVEQAIRAFAEELKNEAQLSSQTGCRILYRFQIDELIKKRYGEG